MPCLASVDVLLLVSAPKIKNVTIFDPLGELIIVSLDKNGWSLIKQLTSFITKTTNPLSPIFGNKLWVFNHIFETNVIDLILGGENEILLQFQHYILLCRDWINKMSILIKLVPFSADNNDKWFVMWQKFHTLLQALGRRYNKAWLSWTWLGSVVNIVS